MSVCDTDKVCIEYFPLGCSCKTIKFNQFCKDLFLTKNNFESKINYSQHNQNLEFLKINIFSTLKFPLKINSFQKNFCCFKN